MKTLHFQNVVRGTAHRPPPSLDMISQGGETAKDKFPIKVELDAEKRLQAEVLEKRIRIGEYFRDFDKLRKGVISEAAVRSRSTFLGDSSRQPSSPSTSSSTSSTSPNCSSSIAHQRV